MDRRRRVVTDRLRAYFAALKQQLADIAELWKTVEVKAEQPRNQKDSPPTAPS